MIYLLTVNYNSSHLISKLIESLEFQDDVLYQLIVVNNSQEDGEIYELQSSTVKVLEASGNIGFARACNLGLQWIEKQGDGEVVWFINPDAYLTPHSLEQVLPFFQKHPGVAILGSIIYTPEGDIWFAGGSFYRYSGAIIETNLIINNPELDYVTCDWVSGCSCLLNLKQFPQMPQFDSNYFLYYEDFDFCQNYKEQGYLVAVTQKIAVIHQPSSITNRDLTFKFKHSTYSYLFSLAKHSSKVAFALRFMRLSLYGLLLLPIKPQVALGKFKGVWMFCRNK